MLDIVMCMPVNLHSPRRHSPVWEEEVDIHPSAIWRRIAETGFTEGTQG